MSKKVCPMCGSEVEVDEYFCYNCGAKISTLLSLEEYKQEIITLSEEYETKEKEVLKLIEKRFDSSEMTYYKFKNEIDNCRDQFYKAAMSSMEIIEILNTTEKVQNELKNNVATLKIIVGKINDLIKELIIHSKESMIYDSELNELFNEIDELIDSIKDYK